MNTVPQKWEDRIFTKIRLQDVKYRRVRPNSTGRIDLLITAIEYHPSLKKGISVRTHEVRVIPYNKRNWALNNYETPILPNAILDELKNQAAKFIFGISQVDHTIKKSNHFREFRKGLIGYSQDNIQTPYITANKGKIMVASSSNELSDREILLAGFDRKLVQQTRDWAKQRYLAMQKQAA